MAELFRPGDWPRRHSATDQTRAGSPTTADGTILRTADEDLSEWYAQIHAWRALAQLKAEEAIPALVGILHQIDDEGLNGFIIYDLVRLKAVEHVELISRAFAAGAVDELIMGDFEDVQVELGLLEKRLTPERPLSWHCELPSEAATFRPARSAARAEKKQKNKRIQEKKSRKRNRRKK
jgi:hypothetical protein